MEFTDNSDPKQRGRPFVRGQSGNPSGKPKGTRHKVTQAMELLLEGEAEALTRKAIEMALAGDMTALRICLDRLAPVRRDRHVPFDLPAIATPSDAVGASTAIVAAVSAGELTPSEAADLGKLLEAHVRVIEAAEFEDRLNKLEARLTQ